jgi:HK97 family phage portal protein
MPSPLDRLAGMIGTALGVVEESRAVHLIRSGSHSILDNTPDGWLASNGPIPVPTWGFNDILPVWWEVGGGSTALPAVGRGLALTSETLAGLPWKCYRGREQIPTPQWILDPQNAQRDGRSTPGGPLPTPGVPFWMSVLSDVILHGNGAVYVPNRDLGGYPLPPVHQLRQSLLRWEPETAAWRYGDAWIEPRDVLLIRGKPPYDVNGLGVGLLTRYVNVLGLSEQLAKYAAGMFTTGIPAGYLSVQGPATAEQLRKLKADWMIAHGNGDRDIAVLGQGVKFDPIAMSPVDSDLVQVGDYVLRDLAHAMGLSAHDLDVRGASDTYANVQDRVVERRTFALMQWTRLVESALDTQLPAGTELKIALDGLERGTTRQRYEEHAIGLGAGFVTLDEVRQMEDRPPLPELPPAPAPIEPAALGGGA